MALLRPALHTVMHVSLPSMNLHTTFLPSRRSQSSRLGSPSVRTARSAATSSASGVLWLTQVCLLLVAVNGMKVFGARMHAKMPDVLRLVSWQPAKSASQ